MKKGQISNEMLYAVGVMLVIFTIIIGIGLNKRSQVARIEETLQMRDECMRFANAISMLTSSGTAASQKIKTRYTINILQSGVIFVRGSGTDTARSVEATCTYTGYTDKDYIEPSDHLADATYNLQNLKGNITITQIS